MIGLPSLHDDCCTKPTLPSGKYVPEPVPRHPQHVSRGRSRAHRTCTLPVDRCPRIWREGAMAIITWCAATTPAAAGNGAMEASNACGTRRRRPHSGTRSRRAVRPRSQVHEAFRGHGIACDGAIHKTGDSSSRAYPRPSVNRVSVRDCDHEHNALIKEHGMTMGCASRTRTTHAPHLKSLSFEGVLRPPSGSADANHGCLAIMDSIPLRM